MSTEVMRGKTPEEQELNRKQSVLPELEEELIQRELDLATLQAELNTFEASYFQTVGVRLAELDEVEAKIAEVEARLEPQDNNIKEQAAQARAQAQKSAEATGIIKESRGEKFKPSESLKKFYREVAKCIHPDLAVDENDRLRRQELMVEANGAYEKGDETKLRAILAEWESSPESIKGEGTAVELVRVIRKIAQVEKRLRAIEAEVEQLENSDLFKLKTRAEKAEDEGRDLLDELASRVEEDIVLAKKRLGELTRRVNK